METIKVGNQTVCAVAGAQRYDPERNYRFSRHCLEVDCPDGRLLYHSLSGELLLLRETESTADPTLREELVKRGFLVPLEFHDRQHCDQVRTVTRLTQKDSGAITDYVVFTTTDCNARCYYCFEKGQRRLTMTEQTARDAANWMLDHAKGEKIKLRWFGGEPLYNAGVIDVISRMLRDGGAAYESTMVTNAYLFEPRLIEKAVKLWNLRQALVTVDGTEAVYNRTKAFIHQDGSAYRRVLSNLERLLEAGIAITVNLNMDAHNAEDLFDLAEELGRRFGGEKGFAARCELLVEYAGKLASFESDRQALDTRRAVNERLEAFGIRRKATVEQGLKLNSCMADDPHSVTILPDGRIGRCEHFGDSEEVGSIYHEAWDPEKLAAWREPRPAEEACEDCVLYPQCYRLKKCNACPDRCNFLFREQRIGNLQDKVRNTWARWKQKQSLQAGGEHED